MEPGTLLAGRYSVAGLVGSGGMAEVYRARDLRLDRDVAVKVLRPGQAGDAVFRARFRREALAVAALDHPGIVALLDTGEDGPGGEPPYLVMEYVEGRTLADLVRGAGRPDVAEARRLTADVLDALAHAHRQGIVHRDIKPANVMVTDRGVVKVMDFGIARPVAVSGLTVTATAMVVGTAEYLPPEQARGERPDPRGDLYATGCLLHELLTGRPPFTGDSPLAVAWKHLEEIPLPPSAHAPGIPPECDTVVLRALAKDPGQRYQDAAAMRAAVLGAPAPGGTRPAADAAADVPVGVPAAPPAERGHGRTGTAAATADAPGRHRPAPATARRHPAPAGPANRPPAPATANGTPRRRRRAGRWIAAAVVVLAVLAGLHAMVRHHARVKTAGTGVAAPDLRGKTVAQARRAALAAHLRLGTLLPGDCAAPPAGRRVCTQQPAPGATLTAGAAISLRISPRGTGRP